MDQNDRYAIEGLFGKLSEVERQAPHRDAGADAFIRERISAQPAAPYFMAQTIVVQEQALNAAQQRIEELEYQLASRPAQGGGGFFSSLFGSSSAPRAMPPRQPAQPMGQSFGQQQGRPQAGPWGQQQSAYGRPAGGGFLAGAAQTAMGVAGGMLLGSAIAGMLGGGEAQAAEDDGGQDDGGDDGGDDSFF